MELFWLAYALIVVIGAAIGAWRRRHVTPYEDPHRTVTALRDKQRLLYYFGTSGEIESHDGLRRRERR